VDGVFDVLPFEHGKRYPVLVLQVHAGKKKEFEPRGRTRLSGYGTSRSI